MSPIDFFIFLGLTGFSAITAALGMRARRWPQAVGGLAMLALTLSTWVLVEGPLAHRWAEGGWVMSLVFAPAAYGVGAAVASVASKSRHARTVALVCMALPALAAAVGYVNGMSDLEQAIAHAAPVDQATIRAMGQSELLRLLELAGLGALGIGAVLAWGRRGRPAPQALGAGATELTLDGAAITPQARTKVR